MKAAETAGIEGVLIKPVSQSLLFDVVMRCLGATLEDPDDDEGRENALSEAALTRLKGLNVLLVEDNDFNQQVATELLADGGVLVEVAENGQAIDTAPIRSSPLPRASSSTSRNAASNAALFARRNVAIVS
jgi:hypothetical protein